MKKQQSMGNLEFHGNILAEHPFLFEHVFFCMRNIEIIAQYEIAIQFKDKPLRATYYHQLQQAISSATNSKKKK